MFSSVFDESNEDKSLFKLIAKNEDEMRQSMRSKLATLERTLEVIAAGVKESKRQGLKSVEYIWNVAGYINTCSLDLAVSGEALMFEQNLWKRRYHARMAAIHIYEAVTDLPNMLGKDFRTSVMSLPNGTEFLNELNSKIKKITSFKLNHVVWLKDIRVCCAAHRDQYLEEQLRIVFEISPTKVLKIIVEFDAILNDLGTSFQKGMHLLPSKG